MIENSQKKILNEVNKRQSVLQTEIMAQVQTNIDECVTAIKEWTDQSLENKVRVDEVQDALKKITDSFHSKLQNMQETSQQLLQTKYADNCQNIVQIKEHLAKILSQVSAQSDEHAKLEERLEEKIDKAKLKSEVDELRDGISELQNDMKLRPEKEEVVQIINSKGNPDEFFADI